MKHVLKLWRLVVALAMVAVSVSVFGSANSAMGAVACAANHSGETEMRYGWVIGVVDCLRVSLPSGSEFVRIEFGVESGSFDVYGGKGNLASLDNKFNFGPVSGGGAERFLDLDVAGGTYTLALIPRLAGKIFVTLSTLEQLVAVGRTEDRCFDTDEGRVCSQGSPITIKGQAVLPAGGHLIMPLAVACSGQVRVTTGFQDSSLNLRLYRPDGSLARSGGFGSFSAQANTAGTWKLYASNASGEPRKISLRVDFPGREDCPSVGSIVTSREKLGQLPVVSANKLPGYVSPFGSAPTAPTPTLVPRPTATPKPVAIGCTSGTAEITSPEDGETVSGVVNIYGTVTCDSGFRYYKFELEDARCGVRGCFVAGPPPECNNTSVVCPSYMNFVRPVEDGLLMRWDTRTVGNGTYVLRMSAVGAGGRVLSQQARVTLTIDN